jgi:hypothetical protein
VPTAKKQHAQHDASLIDSLASLSFYSADFPFFFTTFLHHPDSHDS